MSNFWHKPYIPYFISTPYSSSLHHGVEKSGESEFDMFPSLPSAIENILCAPCVNQLRAFIKNKIDEDENSMSCGDGGVEIGIVLLLLLPILCMEKNTIEENSNLHVFFPSKYIHLTKKCKKMAKRKWL